LAVCCESTTVPWSASAWRHRRALCLTLRSPQRNAARRKQATSTVHALRHTCAFQLFDQRRSCVLPCLFISHFVGLVAQLWAGHPKASLLAAPVHVHRITFSSLRMPWTQECDQLGASCRELCDRAVVANMLSASPHRSGPRLAPTIMRCIRITGGALPAPVTHAWVQPDPGGVAHMSARTRAPSRSHDLHGA